jgi:hypothetical protein
MNIIENNKICQDCLETVVDRSSPDSRALQHLQGCEACRQTASTLELIRREGTAFGDETHPELRLRLIKSLAPLVAARKENARTAPANGLSWLWKFSLAFAIILVALATTLYQPTTVIAPPTDSPQIASLPAQQSFKLSLNGGEPREVSLDNPVALFANDSGEITLPDQSRLLVSGPARLTLAPRGFHLLQGQVRAEVARGTEEFSATTPHGIITVLGTVFVCETHSRFTTVEVLSGKVRVSSDHAPAVILGPGEKSRMGQQAVGSTETGTIPSLDSE